MKNDARKHVYICESLHVWDVDDEAKRVYENAIRAMVPLQHIFSCAAHLKTSLQDSAISCILFRKRSFLHTDLLSSTRSWFVSFSRLAPKFLLVCFLQQEGKLDDSGDQQQTRQPPPSLSSLFAMFLCCVCDEKRRVTGSRPAAGVCPNCGGGASQVRVLNMFRFCFIPVCCTTHSRLMCTRCGAQLKR